MYFFSLVTKSPHSNENAKYLKECSLFSLTSQLNKLELSHFCFFFLNFLRKNIYYTMKNCSLALNNKSLGTKSPRSTGHGIGVLALD